MMWVEEGKKITNPLPATCKDVPALCNAVQYLSSSHPSAQQHRLIEGHMWWGRGGEGNVSAHRGDHPRSPPGAWGGKQVGSGCLFGGACSGMPRAVKMWPPASNPQDEPSAFSLLQGCFSHRLSTPACIQLSQ